MINVLQRSIFGESKKGRKKRKKHDNFLVMHLIWWLKNWQKKTPLFLDCNNQIIVWFDTGKGQIILVWNRDAQVTKAYKHFMLQKARQIIQVREGRKGRHQLSRDTLVSCWFLGWNYVESFWGKEGVVHPGEWYSNLFSPLVACPSQRVRLSLITRQ